MLRSGPELPLPVIAFAKRHNIPFSQLYDAKGLALNAIRKQEMEALGAIIAFNAKACGAASHTIRTRANHCAECDTSRIAHTRRHVEPGFVYIAISKAGILVKIGTSINLASRRSTLNRQKYGGQSDWVIKHTRFFQNAGRIESEIQAQLAAYHVAGTYFKEGELTACYELFRCSEGEALELLSGAQG